MSKQRHRRSSQGRTTTETRPQTCSGVAQFSVSEVAQFSMSLDNVAPFMRRNRRAAAFGITELLVGAALANHLKPQLLEDVCNLRWLENRR
jgi:hypothetical protein